jgi:hypothetical protein
MSIVGSDRWIGSLDGFRRVRPAELIQSPKVMAMYIEGVVRPCRVDVVDHGSEKGAGERRKALSSAACSQPVANPSTEFPLASPAQDLDMLP